MLNMPKLSVILPTYNERDNIEPLVSEIFKYTNSDTEVIIVDDSSPDGTCEKAQEISQKNRNVRVLKRDNKLGVASAISDGISLSNGEIVVWMDADFSMPPKFLPEMITALKENDVAVGSRYITGGSDKRKSPIRKFTSKAINTFASFLLSGGIFKPKTLDYTSGFIAAWRRVIDRVPINGKHGEYCIDFLYNSKLNGFKITEIPYECLSRRSGESKIVPDLFSLVKQGARYCITIFCLRFKRCRRKREKLCRR